MNSFARQLATSLRLHLRNRMGLLYGYLFPTIFLVAFWVLYRYERVPLIRHMDELLTVTVLGGACFGFPTSLVAERERGVWRRYRLSPVPTGSLLASTMLARYLLLLSAGLLQIALALLIGMPFPKHPLQLWAAFTLVGFALLGLGLVIAALADNVPAVQALGQCIFLPMLIIGGVAVRLESLPEWAKHLSAFFPGRYAVETLQATVSGQGLGAAPFPLLALLLIGAAAFVAGGKMFRWDAQQRFTAREGRGWLAVALASWLAVGVLAEAQGLISVDAPTTRAAAAGAGAGGGPGGPVPGASGEGTAAAPGPAAGPLASAPADSSRPGAPPSAVAADSALAPAEAAPPPATAAAPAAAAWQSVTLQDIDRDIAFDRLPPDGGVVTPIAASGEPDEYLAGQLDCMRKNIPEWAPARVSDPVQRVRNILDLAAVPDMYQMEEIESLVPYVVFDRLRQDYPRDTLIKILYWIAMDPAAGDPPALDQRLGHVCLDAYGTVNPDELRVRTSIYAAKLLGRLTGKIGG